MEYFVDNFEQEHYGEKRSSEKVYFDYKLVHQYPVDNYIDNFEHFIDNVEYEYAEEEYIVEAVYLDYDLVQR